MTDQNKQTCSELVSGFVGDPYRQGITEKQIEIAVRLFLSPVATEVDCIPDIRIVLEGQSDLVVEIGPDWFYEELEKRGLL